MSFRTAKQVVAWRFEHLCFREYHMIWDLMCGSIYLVIIRGIQLQQNVKNSDAKKCEYSAAKFSDELCYSVVLRVGYVMCVDTIIKSSQTQHKDNCFSFGIFQSYNFKTPMVNNWTCSATSLKFSSQSIHHGLGCMRIKNLSQVNLQLLLSGPLRVITLRIP